MGMCRKLSVAQEQTHRQSAVENQPALPFFGCVAWSLSEICFLCVKIELKINNIHFT